MFPYPWIIYSGNKVCCPPTICFITDILVRRQAFSSSFKTETLLSFPTAMSVCHVGILPNRGDNQINNKEQFNEMLRSGMKAKIADYSPRQYAATPKNGNATGQIVNTARTPVIRHPTPKSSLFVIIFYKDFFVNKKLNRIFASLNRNATREDAPKGARWNQKRTGCHLSVFS